jgi:hypothetical protein
MNKSRLNRKDSKPPGMNQNCAFWFTPPSDRKFSLASKNFGLLGGVDGGCGSGILCPDGEIAN